MTVYNGVDYLREAIEGVLEQTLEDFEFLIIDDASTDDSVALIRSYPDQRIRLVLNEENIGQASYQAVRASASALATWDDHEFRNDYNPESIDAAQREAMVRAEVRKAGDLYYEAAETYHQYKPTGGTANLRVVPIRSL